MQSTISGTSGDNMVATNAILVVEKTEGAVHADFTPASPVSGDKPFTVNFDSSASTGYITGYAWTFGDGGTSTAQNPSHEYTTRGTYDVSLTVTGIGTGNTDTKTRTGLVTIKEPAPVIDFSATPTSGTRPLTAVFTASNTGGQVNTWDWDFGDGSAHGNVQNPTHVYQNEGTYTVTLTATGPDYTAVKTRSGYIQVGAAVISVTINPAGVNFGTMQAGVDSTGNTQVAVTTTGGTGWSVAASANNGGYMKSGTTPLANVFQLANGAGSFHAMNTDFTSFMTGTADEDRTDTANVKQVIASSDGPGNYGITITFTPSFN
jgi:PKD repeat protein